MDLQELRNEINDIDSQLQELFNKRMQISFKVAEYKIANNMPVFQSKRENEILDHVKCVKSVLPKHHGYFKVPSVPGVFCRLR